MEYKEQTRVLRERLETAQKKNSHLETEVQQHHIRESLRQVSVARGGAGQQSRMRREHQSGGIGNHAIHA